ncbi:MAG: hypothetical protein NTV63_05555 [Candidatus Woesearchaeota archaeon]|nr:hypothetical protein [Candidatus Woesearchaeota archaeon]
MFLADSAKKTWNFLVDVIDNEEEENVLLFFMDSNENPLIPGNDAEFVAVSAIFGTVLIALKLLFKSTMSIFTTIFVAILLAALSYLGILYFRWVNKMAEEHKIAGIALSILLIFVIVLIIS